MTDESESGRTWSAVRAHLEQLIAIVDARAGGNVDLMRFADELVRFVRAYRAALEQQGKTSMRIDAVLMALDLKTPKSALLRFLGRDAN